jgi:hypothetical protein
MGCCCAKSVTVKESIKPVVNDNSKKDDKISPNTPIKECVIYEKDTTAGKNL